MGRAPCGEKSGLKKGPWSPEEDEKLVRYVTKYGYGRWSNLPKDAGLARSGKSCRLRWTNYLRPDIKRGRFSLEEETLIIELHRVLGNRWSAIAAQLPGRTDNEIKNYWNTHIRKRLLSMGIDPVTHAPLPDILDPSALLKLAAAAGYYPTQVEETGSIISSSSGTIVSTAYTSSVSRPSTTISMEAAMHFASLEMDEDVNGNSVQACQEAEDTRVESEMASLLSECKGKLGDEAISSIIENIRTMLLGDDDDSSNPLNPQGSSDIHKVTRSVMPYIRLLMWENCSSVDAAMPTTFVCHTENERYRMIMEMLHCLQEKLANISESFSDQGLRFLFLLNNSYFIQESLSSYSLQRPLLHFDLNDKIEDHMERYLQVSWAPLSSCLFNATPLCLWKNYAPLSTFESEFQKIYTTQKEWKVPDPELRRKLRGVIIGKIIPGYTDYIEDNKVTNPKFSPQELEGILQELFEG